MEILDKLVLPQSAEHLSLLVYILALTLIIFLPYAGILSAAAFYSVVMNVYARKKEDNSVLRFSRELIEIVTARKSFPVIFGILPLITLIIAYTQQLHKAVVDIPMYLFIALLFFTISILLLYFYKYTFYVDDIFKLKEGNVKIDSDIIKPERSEDFVRFIQGNLKSHKFAAASGLILLLISVFIAMGSIQLSFEREYWSENFSFSKQLLSYNSVVKFLYFILASFAVTSGGILYYYFRLQKDKISEDESYGNLVLKFSLVTGITLVLILPFFIMVNLLATPKAALSNLLFGIAVISIVLLFITSHYFYVMIKQKSTAYSIISFYILLAVFILFVINDQVAFNTSSQKHRVILASDYDKFISQIKQVAKGPESNGEEIYKRLCVSCHRFDQKLVGPAYHDVLPKYEGKQDQLVSFIQSPAKVNPEYPPMPALGLKPAEAKAVADYEMIEHMKGVFAQRSKEAGENGEQIFKLICSSCHSYDQDLVGPSFNTVISKYAGNEQSLINFISKPEKINPDFPQMPNPNLTAGQLKAISTYVISEYQKRKAVASR